MRRSKASAAGGPDRRLFAHPQDLHCVVYHLVTLAAYAAAFWVWLVPERSGVETVAERGAFVLAAALLLGWISGIDVGVNFHNHTHRRIFRSSFLNRWFGRLWTFSGGWPAYYWNHCHVVVHHANVLEREDWTVPRRGPDGEFENIYRYLFAHWPWRYAVSFWRDFRSGVGGHRVGRRALKELAIFLALWSIPFWIDPLMGLCLWVLPHWIANVMIMGSGMYVQHAGCRPKSEGGLKHSNTFLSKFFNLTMFNIGYHIEHHDHPAVHWSVLPRLHAELAPKLAEAGAHVVPYGYYRAAHLLSGSREGRETFARDAAVGFERYEGAGHEPETVLRPHPAPLPPREGVAAPLEVSAQGS